MSRLSLRSPLVQAAMRRPTAQSLPRCPAPATSASGAARAFSHFPSLRPSPFASSPFASSPTAFRARQTTTTPTSLFTPTSASTTTSTTSEGGLLDLVPKSSISSHPAFSAQIRCGPRPTMSGATRLVQKRRHGFLSRVKTHNGKKTIARRRAKGRKKLGH